MLVLDANILIRAALGSRVLDLLTRYADHADFLAPDVAFYEAREHLPAILDKRCVARMPDLDGGYRLVRPWCGNLDDGQPPTAPRVTSFTMVAN